MSYGDGGINHYGEVPFEAAYKVGWLIIIGNHQPPVVVVGCYVSVKYQWWTYLVAPVTNRQSVRMRHLNDPAAIRSRERAYGKIY